jgi:hypothetical protein
VKHGANEGEILPQKEPAAVAIIARAESEQAVLDAVGEIEGLPTGRVTFYGSALQAGAHDKRRQIFNAAHARRWEDVASLLAAYEVWYRRAAAWSAQMWERQRQFHAREAAIDAQELEVLRDGGATAYDHSASLRQARHELGLDEPPPLD